MANTYNKYQLKRTSVSGRTPNTTSTSNSSFLDTAELALNLTDKKMFSSNGTSLFEIGANLSSINVTGNTIFGNTTINGFANITGTLAAGNTTITGLANVTTLNSGNVTVTGVANVTGNVSITDTMFGNNVVLTGNLTVSGTTTYINTVTLNVGDNIVTLNADWPSITPTENAGIEVNRGSLANVQFVWDETNDRWTTNSQPMFVGGTLAAGNTTVTGFVNVSSYGTFGGTVNATALNIGANVNVSTSLISVGNSTVNTQITAGNVFLNGSLMTVGNTTTNTTLNGSLFTIGNTTSNTSINNGTANVSTLLNIGANVNLTTTSITVGNSTVNAVHNQTNFVVGNTTVNTSISATAVTSSATLGIGNTTVTGFANVSSTLNVVGAATVNGALTVNNTAALGNTTVTGFINVSSYGTFGGTVNATALNVGANLNLSTSQLNLGNSTVNTTVSQTVSSFNANSTVTALYVAANGNVGVGTSTPDAKLAVSGTANVSGATRIGGAFTVANTAALGNTTVTGSANVSTTLNVVGAATVNGALTVNNTAAIGNTTVTGFANVSSTLNVVGAATVNGALTVNNTASVGNTTTTGFINVSSYGTFGGTVNATAINVGANVNLTTTSITVGDSTVNTSANSTLISSQTIGGPNTGIMLNGMNMFAFSNSGGNAGNPTFRSSIANNQTVLRVLPNGVVNVATQAQFEFFGVDYFSNATNWHNLRILAQTDRFVIDTARGANSDPARPIVFDIGGTGSSNATNANYPAVLVLSANGKVGISNATPDATLTVTGTANVSGNVAVGGTLSVTGINASGNTTITGFLNVSSYGTFGGTVNATALNIGANVSVNTSTIAIGNSTVNTWITGNTVLFGSNPDSGIGFYSSFANYSIAMKPQNATQAGRLDATSDYNMYFQMNGGTNRGFVFRGSAGVNSAIAQIDGTGNFYTLGSHYIGNTTTNTVITTSLISIGNSTVNTQISAGNVFLNGSLLTVGNTTVNTSINNGTANVSTLLNVGANVNLSTTQLNVGNTTVNAVLTSTSLLIANSANVTTNGHEFVIPATGGQFKLSRDTFGNSQGLNFQSNGSGSFLYFNSSTNNAKPTVVDVPTSNTTADIYLDLRIAGLSRVKANSTIVTITGAANVTGPFTVSNTTSLSGNTTITGFANVSTTLNVVGAATVNGALTVNNTAALGNTTITGSANVSSTLNVVGAATVNGALTINNTAALGNTTITGSANVSTTLNVVGAATVNGALTVNNTAALGNTTITGFANASSLNVVGAATVNGAFTVNNTASVGNTTITGFANVSSTLNVVGAATVNGALTVNNTAAVGNTTITGTLGTGNTTVTGNLTVTGNTTANNIRAQGSVQIDGNLTVSGNTITIGVTNLAVSDNIIYLNEPETATITSATSNATSFIYTALNGFSVGQVVTVAGITPSGYNVTSNSVTFANATTFAVANTVAGPGAYVSGGTATARVDTNPDIGFAANYNDGTYRHAGFFRDATDGVFKVFDQYLPEPSGAFIDTANASFRIADFQSNNTVMGSANVAGTTRLGVSNANYLQVVGAASAGVPTISAQGTDASIDIGYATKSGANHYFRTNGTVDQFVVAHTASAVNYAQATGAATGAGPTLSAQGSDTNVDFNVLTKGTGGINLRTGNGIGFRIYDGSSGSPQVNFFAARGRATGSGPYLTIDGTDTNISANFGTKGTGVFSFLTASTTLEQFRIAHTASAVNYISVTGGATGGSPYFLAAGTDTNIGMVVATKGSGGFSIWTNSGTTQQFNVAHTGSAVNMVQVTGGPVGTGVTVSAQGADSNVSMTVATKGTGSTTIFTPTAVGGTATNARDIVNMQGLAGGNNLLLRASLLRHTTGSDWTGVSYRLGHLVDVTAMSNIEFNPVGQSQGLAVNVAGNAPFQVKTSGGEQFRVADTASAVNYIQVTGNGTTNSPVLSVQGSDTNIGLVVTSKGNARIGFFTNNIGTQQLSVTHTASAVNYVEITGAATGGRPSVTAAGSDTNIDLALYSKGTGGIAHIANNALQMYVAATASAVNYVQVNGAATGGSLIISAQGSDTNIPLILRSKGAFATELQSSAGPVLFQALPVASSVNYLRATPAIASSGPVLSAQGSDTNIDVNLTSKGTGVVVATGGILQAGTTGNNGNLYLGGPNVSLRSAYTANVVGIYTNNAEQVRIASAASAVNYLQLVGSATGSAVGLSAQGSDSNVGMSFAGKGTGTLNLNSNTTFNANTLLFTGSNTSITLRVADNGVLSFEGGAGQLFSIANNLTGQIFAVNDISGIPSLEVYSNGQVNVARYGGNVSIGTSTSTLTVNGAVSFGNAVTFSNTIAVTGTATFSNTIVANGALTLSSTGAALTLSNTSSAFINFGAGGYAAPSVGTRSTGAKIVLFNQLSATAADYAIGVEGTHMWFGTDSLVSGYKWYANTTNIMTSNTTGLNIQSGGLSINGTSAIDSNRNGSFANVTIAGNLTVSGTTTYINTTTLNIGDNIITLNADLPGATAPTENAGIEVNRGSSANANFIWDETNDVWASQINGISKLTVSNTTVTVTGNTSLFLGGMGGSEGGELIFANTTGGTGPIVDVDGGNDWRYNTYNTTSNYKFNTGSSPTTKLQISANGNVGIGNTTPIHLLRVEGTGSFSSTLQATTFDLGSSMFFGTSGGNPAINFDSNDYLLYNKTTNLLTFAIGGTAQLTQNTTVLYASANVGIGNSAPTDKLRVEGTLSHLGLVPSTGTGIDQIFTATPSITLNTTWQSTGVTSTSLANGSYMVQLFANDIAAGGTANNEYYTGMMSWYSADTNSTVLDEIPLHRAGVSGSNNAIFLATQRTATANTSDLLLMISSAANNSGASTYTIKFRRMI